MDRSDPTLHVKRTFMVIGAGVLTVFILSLLFMVSQGRKGLSDERTVLAVLPFETESTQDSTDRYAGFAEGLAAYFGRSDPQILGVLGPASTSRYMGLDPVAIGNELLADLVVTGQEYSAEDNLILAVELIQVSDRSVLWSREFQLTEEADLRGLLVEVSTEVTSILDLPRW